MDKCIVSSLVGLLVEVQAWQYNLRLAKTGEPADRMKRGSREGSGSTWAYDSVTVYLR
jgi:hypothetical protein